MKRHTIMRRGLFLLLLTASVAGCYATWDVVKTKPSYADKPGYVHYPAPYTPTPVSSRMP